MPDLFMFLLGGLGLAALIAFLYGTFEIARRRLPTVTAEVKEARFVNVDTRQARVGYYLVLVVDENAKEHRFRYHFSSIDREKSAETVDRLEEYFGERNLIMVGHINFGIFAFYSPQGPVARLDAIFSFWLGGVTLAGIVLLLFSVRFAF